MKNYITKHRYIVALVGGGLISLVPLFMIQAIISLFPSLAPEGLETVSKFFSGEFGIIQLIMLISIVIVAPVVEELIFRGLLWHIIKKVATAEVALVATTIIFAISHIDFLHVIALLPISFFFGWLRYRYDSIKPSIVAHMSNNFVAMMLTLL